MREKSRIENLLGNFARLSENNNDNKDLLQMSEAEKDESSILETEKAIFKLEKDVKRFEVEALLKGEADANNAFLEIHSGAGGTESCDWAAMLMRMYIRFAEASGYKAEL